jgi:glutathione-regulated potassium-efflux system ancillary protein KefF
MPRTLILTAHPQLAQSRITRALMYQAAALPAEVAQVRDLYALYPDYLIDVAAEQAALSQAELVVWLCPTHWYGLPPMLKLWMDEVLTFGWAYGQGGTKLQGKDLWLVTSTGGPEESYSTEGSNRFFFDAFMPPHEQTAALCGMRFLPPLVQHGAHRLSEAELAAHADVFAQRLATWPDWPEMADLPTCMACEVPPLDRPREG